MRTPVRIALLLAVASCALLAAAPGASASYIRGVDVSNHQGRIAWAQVPDGIRFAFVKASEDTTFIDSWYDRNRRQATRQGVRVGAYHFARPGGYDRGTARADARLEARFFLQVARPRRGDLRPVLDLEVTGGLTPSLLIPWTKAFVKTVERLRDTKSMIYTTPSFWQTAMNDTRWFANHGYRSLWIAHWGVSRPSVPAENWAGRGWTFWQFTDCGSVRGIEGCVDKNKYRYQGFRRVKVRGGG